MDELINNLPLYALEGSAFAGKTTLLQYLKRNYKKKINVIPEVGEYVGGDKNFPNIPFKNLDEAKASTYFFVEIEKQRYQDAVKMYKKNGLPVLLDRFTFLSSLVFYDLLGKTKTHETKLQESLLNHAIDVFSQFNLNKSIPAPKGIVFLQPANQEVFQSRLSRGTKNTVFTKWDNYRHVNKLYRKYLNTVYSKSTLKLSTRNTKSNLKEIATKTLNFVNKKLAIHTFPDNPFQTFKVTSLATTDVTTEMIKFKSVRNKAKNLIRKTKQQEI